MAASPTGSGASADVHAPPDPVATHGLGGVETLVRARVDLAELPEDEAAELLAEAGLGEPGLAQLARAGSVPWACRPS